MKSQNAFQNNKIQFTFLSLQLWNILNNKHNKFQNKLYRLHYSINNYDEIEFEICHVESVYIRYVVCTTAVEFDFYVEGEGSEYFI